MTIGLVDSDLFGDQFGDPLVRRIFSDRGRIGSMVEVEVALARAQASLGMVPERVAAAIAEAALRFEPDMAGFRDGLGADGVPTIALVRQLRTTVGGAAADYVHYGATTQDIVDTAAVLQIRAATDHLLGGLRGLVAALAEIAERHRHTIMAARTHSQQALPTTFGLKAAGWLLPLVRHCRRWEEIRPRVLCVQFGGAAGTLASLGTQGPAVGMALAKALDLGAPPLPWHAQRDSLAEYAGWLSLVTGSLGKMAQDVILLAQSEVGELRESGDPSRGGSSSMPQKRNPVVSEAVVAAARANAAHLSAMHNALIQEHERATHGWQLEWLTLPTMIALTAGAIRNVRVIADSMEVMPDAMVENMARLNWAVMGEPVAAALARVMPRPEAAALVREASIAAAVDGLSLIDAVRTRLSPDRADGIDWPSLSDPAGYLGAAQEMIDGALAEARTVLFGE